MVVLPSNVPDANPGRMLHIWAPATGLACYIEGWMCGLIATSASLSTEDPLKLLWLWLWERLQYSYLLGKFLDFQGGVCLYVGCVVWL